MTWSAAYALVPVLVALPALPPDRVNASRALRSADRSAVVHRRIGLIVHNLANMDVHIVDGLLDEAARVWQPYGIEIAKAAEAASDTRVTHPRETVRIVIEAPTHRGSGQGAAGALGWIEFLENGTPRDILHISVEGARRLMLNTRLAGRRLDERTAVWHDRFLVRALGRGLAHELGHYLLQVRSHAATGLMREHFRGVEMLTDGLKGLELAPRELASLQQVTARQGPIGVNDPPR